MILAAFRKRFMLPVYLLNGIQRSGHLDSRLYRDLWMRLPRGLRARVGRTQQDLPREKMRLLWLEFKLPSIL